MNNLPIEILPTYYVAECMEFQSLGEKYENIPSIEEAIEIFKSIPKNKRNMGNGIGIAIYDGNKGVDEWSLYDGDIDSLEYYPKEIRENETVLKSVQILKSSLNITKGK